MKNRDWTLPRLAVASFVLLALCYFCGAVCAAAPDPVGPWDAQPCPCVVCDCPECDCAQGAVCECPNPEDCGIFFARADQNHTHYCPNCGAAESGAGHDHYCDYCGTFTNVIAHSGTVKRGPTRGVRAAVAAPVYVAASWRAPDPVTEASAPEPRQLIPFTASPPSVRYVYVKDCNSGGCRMIPIAVNVAPNAHSFAPITQSGVQTGYFASEAVGAQWAQSYAIQSGVRMDGPILARLGAAGGGPLRRLVSLPFRVATAPVRGLLGGRLRGGCGG